MTWFDFFLLFSDETTKLRTLFFLELLSLGGLAFEVYSRAGLAVAVLCTFS